ncbi:MAG: hypothetical protein QM790_15545 [Nibricoccus sp.]
MLARENPFASAHVLQERYRFDEAAWANLEEKLRRLRGRGALVGPKGFGKTTLLEDLAARLRRQGYRTTIIRLSEEAPRLPAKFDAGFFRKLGEIDAVFLDGAEQLSLLGWLGFKRRTRHAGAVIVTTHREGRFPVLHRCQTSPALLQELVSSLGEKLSYEAARALHARHRGNIREALRSLYDVYAEKI